MKRYYFRTNGTEVFMVLFYLLLLTRNIYDLCYVINTPLYKITNIVIIIGTSVALFFSIWLIIVVRFNLSYVQIDGENVVIRKGFMKTVRFTCDYQFIFIEKKDRIRKVKVLDKEGKQITAVGNGFEISLKDFQSYVNSKNLSDDE